ncbi:hypothetical protein ACIBL8_30880 [Streptomyces sp. NPDC050523]|uniref:DUF7919 family protein n=1 Tax=Streptomyces sp. NPDC050523 TaxID=3365622 RepID=UPI0037BD1F0C
MPESAVQQLIRECSRARGVSLGTHYCELCPPHVQTPGNGEVHIISADGTIFCAPQMVGHYVTAHDYVLPPETVDALMAPRPFTWNDTAERLSAILHDEHSEVGWRVDAAMDLSNWQDARAWTALLHASQDEALVEVSDMQIGISMGIFWARQGRVDDAIYDSSLPQVRWGIYREMQRSRPDLATGLKRPPDGYDY